MFTQSLILLTSRELTLDDVEGALGDFEVLGRTGGDENAHWAFGAPALVVPLPGTVDGRVVVDVINERWPDVPGDPEEDPGLFAAWSMGGFGPGAFPGCLERAGTQCWTWKQASVAVRQHKGFIRLRTTYVADDETTGVPDDQDLQEELLFLTKMAHALGGVVGVMCLFDPAGEAIRPPQIVDQAMEWLELDDALPLDLWTNVRVGKLDDEGAWLVMDSVGMQQLGLPDVEVAFPREAFTFEQIDELVRDVLFYLATSGDVITDGDGLDGPDDTTWIAVRFEGGRNLPPRPVIRLVQDGAEVPEAFIARPQ